MLRCIAQTRLPALGELKFQRHIHILKELGFVLLIRGPDYIIIPKLMNKSRTIYKMKAQSTKSGSMMTNGWGILNKYSDYPAAPEVHCVNVLTEETAKFNGVFLMFCCS